MIPRQSGKFWLARRDSAYELFRSLVAKMALCSSCGTGALVAGGRAVAEPCVLALSPARGAGAAAAWLHVL